jgi:hypothetical protein
MPETKRSIERAGRQVPAPSFTLKDLRGRRDRHHRRRRIGSGIVGVGVTLAVVVAAVVSIGSSHEPGRVIPRDGGTDSPATGSRVTIAPGDYSYQHVQMFSGCGTEAGGALTLCPDPRVDFETWWKADGSGRIAVTAKQDYGIDAGVFGPSEFPTEGDLTGFPLDPDELRSFLLARSDAGGPSPGAAPTPLAPGAPLDEGRLWTTISDYLGGSQYPNTTPALRASMLDVLASLSMVTRADHATDPLGRDALALRFVAEGGEVTVFMDPVSHDFLGRSTVYPGEGSSGAVVVRLAGATGSTDDRPTGDDRSVAAP